MFSMRISSDTHLLFINLMISTNSSCLSQHAILTVEDICIMHDDITTSYIIMHNANN